MELPQILKYFETVKLLRSFSVDTHEIRCIKWLELYENLDPKNSHLWSEKELPILLALIHPDHYYDKFGQDISTYLHDISRTFRSSYQPVACEIDKLIADAHCPYYHSGSKLRKDHIWPWSLGGASSTDNLLFLCKDCNEQKSNSPLLFPGLSVPSWLKTRIITLSTLKQ